MIETYKLQHGFEELPFKFFHLNTNNLRGNSLKLLKPDHWTTTDKGNLFVTRLIDFWDVLFKSVVTAVTIATFKAWYDRHINNPQHWLT